MVGSFLAHWSGCVLPASRAYQYTIIADPDVFTREVCQKGTTQAVDPMTPVEGQVNRLKLIKRSMYGQEGLDLLTLRVLHTSPKSLERKNKKKQAQ